ncbi:MAG: hypothetical protein ACO1SX_21195 [Actinomycetota bacterium]
MPKRRWDLRDSLTLFGCVIPILVFVAAPFAAFTWMDWSSTVDYSTHPAEQVFREVTGVDPEPGVSDLRVSGHSYALGMKHWVWITCSASEAAVKRITNGAEPLDALTAARAQGADYAGSKRFRARDQDLVGWRDLARATSDEVHYISGRKPNSSFIWAGVRIYDRMNRRAFIHSAGD